MRDPALCDSQVLSTTSTSMNQRSMKYHEGDTITTITKEVITKTTTKVKMNIMVRRIGIRTPKVLTKRRMIRKSPKDKDVYLTLTKDVKFCCPAEFDENIFACTCRMIQEKVNNARQAGVTDIKTVNTVKKGQFHACL